MNYLQRKLVVVIVLRWAIFTKTTLLMK